jgi:hypothetical protein
MKLQEIYRYAVQLAKDNDPRTAAELEDDLRRVEERYRKMGEEERERFDVDALWNPYADSRLVRGGPDAEVNGVLWGIDMPTGEMLLADRLRERGESIDAVIGHHQLGNARSKHGEVLHLQEHMFAQMGMPITVAEDVLAPRINEVHRYNAPPNYDRAVDAARLLDLPLMCLHSVTDNLVDRYLSNMVEEMRPKRVEDVIKMLLELVEYRHAASNNNPPEVYVGDRKRRAGRIALKMTGGTAGPEEMYEKLADAGVGTVVLMHPPEGHLEEAKRQRLDVVVSGHMATDPLGITPCSGSIRVRRSI